MKFHILSDTKTFKYTYNDTQEQYNQINAGSNSSNLDSFLALKLMSIEFFLNQQ